MKPSFKFEDREVIGIRDCQWYIVQHNGKHRKTHDVKNCVILKDKCRKMTLQEARIVNHTCWKNDKDVPLDALELIVRNFGDKWDPNGWLKNRY